MSIAALEVEALAGCLAARRGAGLEGLWREFYPRTLEAISGPWAQCLSLDMLHETTRFERPKGFAMRRPALLWAQRLSICDPTLRAALLRTANLVPGPGDGISLASLMAAQARIWMTGARPGVAPAYRLTT